VPYPRLINIALNQYRVKFNATDKLITDSLSTQNWWGFWTWVWIAWFLQFLLSIGISWIGGIGQISNEFIKDC